MASHRARVLHALGLVSWQRRRSGSVAAISDAPAANAAKVAGADGMACVVVLPAACATRELDLLGRALTGAGAALARAARVRVPAQGDPEVPEAACYLACGEAQAHALGRSLPAQVAARAQIVLVDEPDRLLSDAAAKRRLWIALRTLRRRLMAGDR